jgi:hypothetical protein
MLKCSLLIVLFAILLLLSGRPAQAVPIISAPFVTLAVGDTFIIPILITGACGALQMTRYSRSQRLKG